MKTISFEEIVKKLDEYSCKLFDCNCEIHKSSERRKEHSEYVDIITHEGTVDFVTSEGTKPHAKIMLASRDSHYDVVVQSNYSGDSKNKLEEFICDTMSSVVGEANIEDKAVWTTSDIFIIFTVYSEE